MKRIISFLTISLIILSILLTGCSSSNTIIGTWAKLDSNGNITDTTMAFYDDGTCLNTPVRTSTSADPVSYKLQEDGMLIFTMEWDGPCVYERTEDMELALDNRDYFYLSGNTLIFHKKEYVRQ